MKTVLLLMGYSNSGKTSLARMFAEEFKFKHIHCIGPTKRLLEEIFDLLEGALDTLEGKATQLPGAPEGYTVGKSLEDLFHFWDDRGGLYGACSMWSQIKNDHNHKFVIDSLRNPSEAKILLDNSDQLNIDIIYLVRTEGIEKSTDQYLEENYNTLASKIRVKLFHNNTGTLNESYNKISARYLKVLAERGLRF